MNNKKFKFNNRNCYQTNTHHYWLGINKDATDEEIREAYYRLKDIFDNIGKRAPLFSDFIISNLQKLLCQQ